MKHVLITGVSSGIGYAIAEELIRAGYFVWGSVRKEEDIHRLKQQWPEDFEAILMDVCREDQVRKAADRIGSQLQGQGLFALINNAGIATPGPLASIPEDVFSRQFEVNVIGIQRVTRLFWPMLLEHLSQELPPIIVNISSVSGRFTSPFLGTYSASKRAVEGMTDALRREGSLLGLRVVSIQPGPIQSRIWEKAGQSPDYFRNSVFEIFSPLMGKAIRFSTDKALPARVVAEKVRQTMNLRRPRPRYIIASNAFTLKILKFLPDRWIDRFALRRLRKMVGVDLKKYTKEHL